MLCSQGGPRSPDTVPVLRLRAAAARRRVLRPARHQWRPPHRRGHRSLTLRAYRNACFSPRSRTGAQVSRQPWDLEPGACGGVEAGRRRRARQGRSVLLPAMAHRQSVQVPYAISSPIVLSFSIEVFHRRSNTA
jgi:hypothetical protein